MQSRFVLCTGRNAISSAALRRLGFVQQRLAPQNACQLRLASSWFPWGKSVEPVRHILQLREPANLLSDADQSSDVLSELASGDLVETASDVDTGREWILVRSPLEDRVAGMSETPLQYLDGWLHNAQLERTDVQLGDKVAARVSPDSHPCYDVLRQLPAYRGDASLPAWIVGSVSEHHTGKVGGVLRNGHFLVQRPSGAIPERIGGPRTMLLKPKERKRITGKAAIIGFLLSTTLGVSAHIYSWLRGERYDCGPTAYPQVVGWTSLTATILSPLATIPCYLFANSQASTICVVMGLNLLFYQDLFGR